MPWSELRSLRSMARAAVPLPSAVALVVELAPSENGAYSHTGGHVRVVDKGLPVVALPNAFGPPRLLLKGPQCGGEDVIHLERAGWDALICRPTCSRWATDSTLHQKNNKRAGHVSQPRLLHHHLRIPMHTASSGMKEREAHCGAVRKHRERWCGCRRPYFDNRRRQARRQTLL